MANQAELSYSLINLLDITCVYKHFTSPFVKIISDHFLYQMFLGIQQFTIERGLRCKLCNPFSHFHFPLSSILHPLTLLFVELLGEVAEVRSMYARRPPSPLAGSHGQRCLAIDCCRRRISALRHRLFGLREPPSSSIAWLRPWPSPRETKKAE